MSSEGRLRSPRYPPSRAPVSGTSRTSLCFTASCPQTLPAWTLFQPPLPSLPCAASWDSHGPLWTVPSQVDIWLSRPGAPTRTECQEGAAIRGIKTPLPRLSLQGSTQQAHVLAAVAIGPVCLSVCLSVCL